MIEDKGDEDRHQQMPLTHSQGKAGRMSLGFKGCVGNSEGLLHQLLL